jgi:hypothetical protein
VLLQGLDNPVTFPKFPLVPNPVIIYIISCVAYFIVIFLYCLLLLSFSRFCIACFTRFIALYLIYSVLPLSSFCSTQYTPFRLAASLLHRFLLGRSLHKNRCLIQPRHTRFTSLIILFLQNINSLFNYLLIRKYSSF